MIGFLFFAFFVQLLCQMSATECFDSTPFNQRGRIDTQIILIFFFKTLTEKFRASNKKVIFRLIIPLYVVVVVVVVVVLVVVVCCVWFVVGVVGFCYLFMGVFSFNKSTKEIRCLHFHSLKVPKINDHSPQKKKIKQQKRNTYTSSQ